MKIHVCDAIMGSGKSSAAIAFMNAHPERRFIYVTPKLTETERIKRECKKLKFVLPANWNENTNHSKIEDTARLIREGRNISTTHQALCLYSDDMADAIREQGYTLILDEALNVLTKLEFDPRDIAFLIKYDILGVDSTGHYYQKDKDYNGRLLRDLFKRLGTSQMIHLDNLDEDAIMDMDGPDDETEFDKKKCYDKGDGALTSADALFYWEVPPRTLSAFSEVFILTYMFEGQDLYYYMRTYGLEYDKIYVNFQNGRYSFSGTFDYMPEYTGRLHDMIRIVEGKRMNSIGDAENAFSKQQYLNKYNGDFYERLNKNIYNFCHNIAGSVKKKRIMWSTFKEYGRKICSPGITHPVKDTIGQFVPMNSMATNDYGDRDILIYLCNVYCNPYKKNYFLHTSGADYHEDSYALSVLVQWIWRSTIRNGKPIDLYLPSSRMRRLLTNWMADVERQYAEWASQQEGGVQIAA